MQSKSPSNRSIRRHRAAAVGITVVVAAAMFQMLPPPATAGLGTSNFEIDALSCVIVKGKPVCSGGANLSVQGGAGALDWDNVANVVTTDILNSQTDNSFGQGTSEDDPVPTVVTGSIPPQKSDLTNFSTITEVVGGRKYLHMYWRRVQEPQGTTNMDFEFNKSTTTSSNGVTPVRSSGDLLLQYDLSAGGDSVKLFLAKWRVGNEDLGTGFAACFKKNAAPCWAGHQDLSASSIAVGSINAVALPASDGLGSMTSHTFGEATVDFTALAGNNCLSFGSVYLKSRASDSFTAEIKDFIAPAPTNLDTCGSIIIRKKTIGGTGTFSFTSATLGTVPDLTTTAAGDAGVASTTKGGLQPGTYDVAESGPPAGWTLTSATCDDGSPVTAISLQDNETVTCTFVNTAKATLIVEKVTSDGAGTFGFTSTSLTPTAFDLTTTGAGAANKGSRTFADILPGTYDVAETVPASWNLTSSSCSDGSSVGNIALDAGETVTCTFTNARERGGIDITKLRKHAASGSDDVVHPGVTFTITGGDIPANAPIIVVTDDQGEACVDGLLVSALAGTYTVTETVPAGYHNVDAAGATRSNVAVTESTCLAGDTTSLEFNNMPLTNITVSVDSQVVGGTGSTIDCHVAEGFDKTVAAAAPDNGDGSYSMNDLEPNTYTCTIVVDP